MIKKIDFLAIVNVENCNPNGDPSNEGKPRLTLEGYGEISAECIKRKIRNRLQDMNEIIFVQSENRCDDGCKSLQDRAKKRMEKEMKDKDVVAVRNIALDTWMDTRLFGQLFAFSGDGLSVGIKGAVSICHSKSTDVVMVKDIGITKSVNGTTPKNGGRASDTMGNKSIVDKGVYIIKGSINPSQAELNHVSEHDIEVFKKAICTLFENDESSARPAGSMDVKQVYWFEQDSKNYISSAKVYDLLDITADGTVSKKEIPVGVTLTELL